MWQRVLVVFLQLTNESQQVGRLLRSSQFFTTNTLKVSYWEGISYESHVIPCFLKVELENPSSSLAPCLYMRESFLLVFYSQGFIWEQRTAIYLQRRKKSTCKAQISNSHWFHCLKALFRASWTYSPLMYVGKKLYIWLKMHTQGFFLNNHFHSPSIVYPHI